MEADIAGHQRKIVRAGVRPAKAVHGEAGIALRSGHTLPFVVARTWNAPAGHYVEQWFLVHPETNEVLYQGPSRETQVWGLQGLSEFKDEVAEPIALVPGRYLVVFALGGLRGGDIEIEAAEIDTRSAA